MDTRRRHLCIRPGCKRLAKRNEETCTVLCKCVNQERQRAQRVSDATGDQEHYDAAVALDRALTAFQQSDYRLFLAAREVGIAAEQWKAIKWGTPQGDAPTRHQAIGA